MQSLIKRFRRKRAVIHIGLGKTGTTAIQNALFAVRDELLANERILYPAMGANHSIYLNTIFRDDIPKMLHFIEPEATTLEAQLKVRERFRKSLQDDLSGEDWDTVVISAEGLSDVTPEFIGRMHKFLKGYVKDFTIIAFVRDPLDWTRSAFQESLKAGETFESLKANMPQPAWDKRITKWLDAFGRKRFRLIQFEPARSDLLAAFCEAASLPTDRICKLAPSLDQANESLSMEAAILLDSLNRQRPIFVDGGRSGDRRWLGTDALMAIPGTPFYLSGGAIETARIQSLEEVRWLQQTFDVDWYPDIETRASAEQSAPAWGPETIDALARTLSNLGNQLPQFRQPADENTSDPDQEDDRRNIAS